MDGTSAELLTRFEGCEAKVVVVGGGYSGLPLALSATNAGFNVVVHDIDAARLERLRAGEYDFGCVDGSELQKALEAGLQFSDSPECLADADAVIVAVPTPLDDAHAPDLRCIRAAIGNLAKHCSTQKTTLVAIPSTVYPGVTRKIIAPMLAHLGLGEVTFLAHTPERIGPGMGQWRHTTPRLVAGFTDACTKLAAKLIDKITHRAVVEVENLEIAEAAKLYENCFRAVNIAFANEMALTLSHMGIDADAVLDAAATKPFGFMRFDPGPGVGGHCVPVDSAYFAWCARRAGKPARMLEAALDVNEQMPEAIVSLVQAALNEQGLAVKGARLLAVGLSFKPDVADVRHSPAVAVVERLVTLGAAVDCYEPCSTEIPAGTRRVESLENVGDYDAVVVLTPHSAIEFARLGGRVMKSGTPLPSRTCLTKMSAASCRPALTSEQKNSLNFAKIGAGK